MEPLPLDPAGYSGSYKLIAGRPSLDLINTVSWPGTDREHDWLERPNNVSRWLAATGLAPAPEAELDSAEVHRVRRLLAEVLRPLAYNERPTTGAVERFNSRLAGALSRRRIDPELLTWSRAQAEGAEDRLDPLDPVVLDAAELITQPDHGRLKHCPSCQWLFEDQTRNGRRRWCDMADCGSRSKARDYYHRHKQQTSRNG